MKKCGIYFLIEKGRIKYIGQTHDLHSRLFSHKATLLTWDNVRFINCDEDKLLLYEERLIKFFKPSDNKVHNVYKKPVLKVHKKRKRWMKFRKLTKKSTIGFGNFRNETVQHMMDMGKIINLVDIYFNLSHITFFDNILDELKISGDWRILKPGIDKEKGFNFKNEFYPNLVEARKILNEKRKHTLSMQALMYTNSVSKDKQFLKTKNL